MNKAVKIATPLKPDKTNCSLRYRGGILCLLLFTITVTCCAARERISARHTDSAVAVAIQQQLSEQQKYFEYPRSVNRFYKQNGYKLIWVAPDNLKTHASEAMLMLDCVLQFGLNYADYHPQDLTYEKLNLLNTKFTEQNNSDKASFDVLLTSVLITYINHLHYGKLNPEFAADKIDNENPVGFDAVAILKCALKQNGTGFTNTVLNVQPRSKAYKKLQYEMYLLAGLYTGDCYEIPDTAISKIAINMERLRWIGDDEKPCISINIPSYTLSFRLPDTLYRFKVIVGKPDDPTPTLASAVSYFTTAPDWKVPETLFRTELLPNALKDATYMRNSHFSIYDENGKYVEENKANLLKVSKNVSKYYARQSSGCDNSLGLIVFRFPNVYDIYLHDTPEKWLFDKQDRAISHGCIRIEHAAKFAGLLLKNDGSQNKITALHKAMAAYRNKTFNLKKPVPIRVVYLTCEVKKGVLIIYNDIYSLDKNLEIALFNTVQPVAMK